MTDDGEFSERSGDRDERRGPSPVGEVLLRIESRNRKVLREEIQLESARRF